ncbi:heme NO-binding domain-containing protein [Hymenobacter coccineus]|uniref:Heme NO-binding domain-containing protein n=1 Tax=Hymenobacter coccineus TaxID=1908235 RepID=A0A1G1TIB8_9BACT|nr:heme NO-binding domain-containing protein [Hymenobacter coccineus]OGX90617.1 hypothetical protein BEN49_22175 [Hymenobacter coccineus]
MHGTILILLKRYIQTQYDHSTWVNLLELAGLSGATFDHKTVYPDENLYALVDQAAAATGATAGELHERLGEYLVPDIMYMYQKLVDPTWRTLDMLEHTEHTMHRQVRREHAENAPPVLAVKRLSPNEVQIDYVSARRMGGLAVGIVRGLAAYYDEADRIAVTPTTSADGQRVSIYVQRN